MTTYNDKVLSGFFDWNHFLIVTILGKDSHKIMETVDNVIDYVCESYGFGSDDLSTEVLETYMTLTQDPFLSDDARSLLATCLSKRLCLYVTQEAQRVAVIEARDEAKSTEDDYYEMDEYDPNDGYEIPIPEGW